MASKDGGKKPHKPSKSTNKYSYFKIDGSTVTRERNSCPKCGPGVFMAKHSNRAHCGKCGFSEFNQ